MNLPSLSDIEQAARVVYEGMPPTPQYAWPLLNARLGLDLWIKHENHTPLGAFKIRGALVYFRRLKESGARVEAVITATRGNHGQAVAFAARREGLRALIYVPRGNSPSKNRAMRALGAELIEFGDDFEQARREAMRRAAEEGLHAVPSFHEALVTGVATYSLELFRAVPDIDVAYAPIGLGSGVSGMCAAREALGLKTEIVGVVSAEAPAYADSFRLRAPVERPAATKIADGIACSATAPEGLEIILKHVSRIVTVTDAEIVNAMRILFDDTHNVAEGAGAAALAAILQDQSALCGKRVAMPLTGGNIDRDVFAHVLA